MRKIILALSLVFPLVSQASSSITCSGDLTITGEDVVSLSCSGDLTLSNNIFSSIATIQQDGSLLLTGPFFDRGSVSANGASIIKYQVEDGRGGRPPLGDSSGLILNGGGSLIVNVGRVLGAGSGIRVQLPDYPADEEGRISGEIRLIVPNVLVSTDVGISGGGSFVTSSVPELTTYSAMLVGLGALGWVGRRKKRD